MDDDGGALLILGLAILFIWLVVLAWIAKTIFDWIDQHPEEAQKVLTGIITFAAFMLWLPQLIGAWVVLFVVCSLPVYAWSDEAGEGAEKAAVVIWLAVIPVVLAVAWMAGILVVSSMSAPLTPVHWLVASASTVITVGTYYWLYFEHPPTLNGVVHHRWPRFIAAEHQMRFNMRVGFIERSTRFKLWWVGLQADDSSAE
jgi:hypothetical protein